MKRMKTRRSFLTEIVQAGAAGVLVPALGCARQGGGPTKSAGKSQARGSSGRARVVLVQCPSLKPRGAAVDRALVRRMLEAGLGQLASVNDPRAALRRWMRPADAVGLKVNCLAGRQMATHLELVDELVALLEQAGIARQQTMVFDRSDGDLRRGGFPLRTDGPDYRCLGNDTAGYEPELTVMPNGASRFSRVATQMASVLINLPILKDHGLAGISGALKDNFGLVHNPNKYHLSGCDPHVAEVNAQKVVRDKQRLIICDAMRVQVDGGPGYNPAAVEAYGGLLFATDPVALDMVAWEIVERLRQKRGLRSLTKDKRRPVHILTAARQGLGVGDRARIDLVEVKVT